jgi:hypothetical protein
MARSMSLSRLHRITARIALAAMLLGALPSAHSGWGMHAPDDPFADLCTAAGSENAGRDGSGAPAGAQHGDHCCCCAKTGAGTALLDRGPAPVLVAAVAGPRLLHEPVVAPGIPPLLTPPPRAPPRLS